MHDIWNTLRWLLLAVAAAPFGYYLLSIWSAVSFFTRPPAEVSRQSSGADAGPFLPPVSILKPCRGLDREAYENFASFCRQDYPEYEILFAVTEPQDPVVPVIEKIMRDFPAVPIRMISAVARVGANGKVNKLVRMAAEARYGLLVINDSDVRVTPDYLRHVAAPFRDPGVGAATAMYRVETNGSLGAELEAVGFTSDFHAGVLSAWRLEGARFALGATMACTRKALEAIGGFEALADYHSDDFELGSRIAKQGFGLELLRDPVTLVHERQSLRQYAQRQVRGALTTRFARPGGHFGLLLTFGLPWALVAAAVAPARWIGEAYLCSYLVLRLAAAWTVGVWGLGDKLLLRRLWLVPFRDATLLFIWVASYFRTRIEWRGIVYHIVDGKLVPVHAAPEAAEAETAARG